MALPTHGVFINRAARSCAGTATSPPAEKQERSQYPTNRPGFKFLEVDGRNSETPSADSSSTDMAAVPNLFPTLLENPANTSLGNSGNRIHIRTSVDKFPEIVAEPESTNSDALLILANPDLNILSFLLDLDDPCSIDGQCKAVSKDLCLQISNQFSQLKSVPPLLKDIRDFALWLHQTKDQTGQNNSPGSMFARRFSYLNLKPVLLAAFKFQLAAVKVEEFAKEELRWDFLNDFNGRVLLVNHALYAKFAFEESGNLYHDNSEETQNKLAGASTALYRESERFFRKLEDFAGKLDSLTEQGYIKYLYKDQARRFPKLAQLEVTHARGAVEFLMRWMAKNVVLSDIWFVRGFFYEVIGQLFTGGESMKTKVDAFEAFVKDELDQSESVNDTLTAAAMLEDCEDVAQRDLTNNESSQAAFPKQFIAAIKDDTEFLNRLSNADHVSSVLLADDRQLLEQAANSHRLQLFVALVCEQSKLLGLSLHTLNFISRKAAQKLESESLWSAARHRPPPPTFAIEVMESRHDTLAPIRSQIFSSSMVSALTFFHSPNDYCDADKYFYSRETHGDHWGARGEATRHLLPFAILRHKKVEFVFGRYALRGWDGRLIKVAWKIEKEFGGSGEVGGVGAAEGLEGR